MKKVISLLLALVMVMGLATTAFAAMEGTLTDGSIKIEDAVSGNTYSAYQILYLESYNATSGTYTYKANSAWETWLKTQTTYVEFDDQNYVTWVEGASAVDFAAAAMTQVETAQINADKTAVAGDAAEGADFVTVEITGLNLGYYLVDTTLGTICSLNTTDPVAEIEEKNDKPSSTKKVTEDSTNELGATNDADIGQVVEFTATVTVQKGAVNYVLHDAMSAGLTYNGVTSVRIGTDDVPAAKYTVRTTDLCNKTGDDACDFEIVFDNDYIKTLAVNTVITIEYKATLNENAVVGLEGNPNKNYLSYGQKATPDCTPEQTTKTYTWDVDVLKYANDDETQKLEGVTFVILNNDKTKVAVFAEGKLTKWEGVPTVDADEDGIVDYPDGAVLTTDANGKIEVDGMDRDSYYLREVETLPGYNKLADDVSFSIDGSTTDATSGELTYTTKVVKVNNTSGSVLPSTGGMGTTIFYILGTVMVLGAAVLLVTKKRMTAE